MNTNTTKSPSQLLAEAQKQQEELAAKIADLLKQTRSEDLVIVKKLCKTHGFTATELKDVLKKRRKVAVKKMDVQKRKYTKKTNM
jgi:hypothetical protein